MRQDSTLNKDIDHAGLCWTLFEFMSGNKEKDMAKRKKMVVAQRDVLLKSGEHKGTRKKPAAQDVASAKKLAGEQHATSLGAVNRLFEPAKRPVCPKALLQKFEKKQNG